MLNNYNANNRRMIMSEAMLKAYQQDANKTSKDDGDDNGRNRQKAEALYEHDDNLIYELGYN